MTRAEKVAAVRRLRDQGVPVEEIAKRMDRAVRTVQWWLTLPPAEAKACANCGADLTGHHGRRKFCSERCRKAQYDLTCVDCGGRVDGTTPSRLPSEPRCRPCADAFNRHWPSEAVIAAIHRFAERHGRPPAAADFNPQLAELLGHRWRSERFRSDGDYPNASTVQHVFGSWNAAIEAAGFTPRRIGEYPRSGHAGAHLADERQAA